MSKPNPKLSVAKAKVASYVKWLRSLDQVEEVYLRGSRARGDHRRDSDWDLTISTNTKLVLPSPRLSRKIAVDLQILAPDRAVPADVILFKV